jgi:putative ABC transport system permease protein
MKSCPYWQPWEVRVMFAKLASRNVKRQIGNYLIYFITVALTVALMFAVNNVIFNEQLQSYAESMSELRTGLTAIVVFVSLIVAFVLGYATSFMLKLRKREFGTYLTLGMTRTNILFIFILETMIMCVSALGIGILFGLFLYQGVMMIMTNLMEMEFAFAAYSLKGLALTVILVCGVFLLSSLTSAIYLKRVSIYNLIHGDKKVEKFVKHPGLWLTVMLVSLGAIIGSCLLFQTDIEQTFLGDSEGGGMLLSTAILAVSIVLFHIGLARSVVNLILKSKRLCAKGTNTFIFRQLSGKLNANSVMAGILAFLITFAVIGANVSFVQKVSEQAALDEYYPFDISSAMYAENGKPPFSLAEANTIISQYTQIEFSISYNVYTTGSNTLHGFTQWNGEGYTGLNDSLVTESDYNRLLTALGKKPIQLNNSFLIVSNEPSIMQYDFSKAELDLNGLTYRFEGYSDEKPMNSHAYFFAVVPDEAVKDLTIDSECVAMDVKDGKYDAEGLRKALSYTYSSQNGPYTFERCDYSIKEYARLQRNSNSAIFIVGALYISVIFVFMAMAILALKTLSELSDDKQRYRILFRLGTDNREQCKTLFHQTFSFFFLPFALPMILSIPTAFICGQIFKLGGFSELMGQSYSNSVSISLSLIAIYSLYFIATYLIAKRNILTFTF